MSFAERPNTKLHANTNTFAERPNTKLDTNNNTNTDTNTKTNTNTTDANSNTNTTDTNPINTTNSFNTNPTLNLNSNDNTYLNPTTVPPPITISSPSSLNPDADIDTESYLISLLNQTLRITIRDSRRFIGKFICVDKMCNIILSCTEEFHPDPDRAQIEIEENRKLYWPVSQRDPRDLRESKDRGGRFMGLVMIPGYEAVRIEIVHDDGDDDTTSTMGVI
ncbi:hypothetical protein BCR39DRAFT_556706 [Naematelia encephala]|uniref:Sm domain-containing protein n=1 Tax=Naematelia encephala TaxID=71784 RepID=A0A1Y2BHR5_9TREE|nr:hypothetical protein BCR39DRAFT_556706 [Naematelia encephala]